MNGIHPVFFIGGRRSDPALTSRAVGGKAANLGRLDRLGLPVPPALALGISVCEEFAVRRTLPDGFGSQLGAWLRHLEEATGHTLGHQHPLLVSVRSSPRVSMPGMLDTILNVGLTEQGVHGLIRRTGNPWLAWDAYRRVVRAFAQSVYRVAASPFDRLTSLHLAKAGAATLDELDPGSMRELARALADLLHMTTGEPLPQEPLTQVASAVEAVLTSWWSPRACEYRRLNGIDESSGTGVLVQAMVFGNAGARSGSGVAFTRNPATGEDLLFVDFVQNAQGEDVVSGRDPVAVSDVLPRLFPEIWERLRTAKSMLEHEFLDMQDFEFTIEDGHLFFLQTRAAKRTPWAALHIAVDLVREKIIEPATALHRLASYDLDRIQRLSVAPRIGEQPIARGTPGSHGAAAGAAVFDCQRAITLAPHQPVILMRPEIATDDIAGLSAALGIVTTFGGATSHAAVVARQLGKVCVVNCAALSVDAALRQARVGTGYLHEGDVVTVDGESGCIYLGVVPIVAEKPVEALAEVGRWRQPAVA